MKSNVIIAEYAPGTLLNKIPLNIEKKGAIVRQYTKATMQEIF